MSKQEAGTELYRIANQIGELLEKAEGIVRDATDLTISSDDDAALEQLEEAIRQLRSIAMANNRGAVEDAA